MAYGGLNKYMDAAAELGRNPVSKHHIQPEYGDEPGEVVITYTKSIDQPGDVANPARGQLNRENEYSPVPVRAWEFGLAIRV